MKALWQQVYATSTAITGCILKNGGKARLDSMFEGKVTVTTSDSRAPGPYTIPLKFGLRFSQGCHDEVEVTNFPPMVLGNGDAMVTMIGGGTGAYDPSTGAMWIYVVLDVNPSNAFAARSHLSMEFSTENLGGSRLQMVMLGNNKGQITLTATGTFEDGFFGGTVSTMWASGTISPQP